jgi:glycosyltransferase involved in cell wall biosynthesis
MKAADDLLISVTIPSFKMGRFIREALESVGAQTYAHWEVLVVDDAGPEDGTRAAVEAFAAKHPDHRVEYIRHATNQGVSVARRTAYKAARGESIAFLDADDAFLPDKLAKQVRILETHPSAVLVHGAIAPTGGSEAGRNALTRIFACGEYSREYDARTHDWTARNYICNSTVMVRRKAVHSEDFPARMLFQLEDWLLWSYLKDRGNFYYLHEPVTRYRTHAESWTSSKRGDRGANEFGAIEVMLAGFPYRKTARDRREAAGVIIRQLQTLLSSRSVSGGSLAHRWGLKFRWALLTAILGMEGKKLWSYVRGSGKTKTKAESRNAEPEA